MILILLIALIIIVILFYKNTNPDISNDKKILLIILRIFAISSLVILIFNPILKFKQKKLLIKKTIILNDVSESMNLTFSNKLKKEYFNQLLDNLKKLNLNILPFANGLNGSSYSTDLEKTLKDLKKLYPFESIKQVLLISDGWFKNDNLEFVKNLPFPIYTVYPNIKEKGVNLAIKSLKYNTENYTNEESPIIITISAQNYKGKANVDLFINDKLYKTAKIDFSKSNTQSVNFFKKFKKSGLVKVKATVSSNYDEITYEDNTKTAIMKILNSKTKIVLISDYLTWDVKFLSRAIRTNRHWKLNNIIYHRSFFEGRKSIKLNNYFKNLSNLIILNNGNLHFNNSQTDLIKNYIKNGGSLLFIGKPIFDFLPIDKNTFFSMEKSSIIPTNIAKEYTTFNWDNSEIPPLDYYFVSPKPGTKVLATFLNEQKSPAILLNDFYNGKIVYFAFYNLWRWQMWGKKGEYTHFIINLTKWLQTKSNGKYVLHLNKIGFLPYEKVKLKVTVFDETLSKIKNLNLKVIIENKKTKFIKETYLLENDEGYIYQDSFEKPGEYSIKIIKDNKIVAKDKFIIFNKIPEKLDRGFNKINLRYIASLSGGYSYTLKDFIRNNIIEKLKSNSKPQKIVTFREIPLYKKIYFILFFLISFLLELYLRKRWGLL